MPNKSFSIYGSNEDLIVESSDQLIVEFARSHVACIVTKDNKRSISGFELFTFSENEGNNFEELFVEVSEESKLLHDSVASSTVYLNHEACIPVPIFKFNKEIAAEYLNLVLGNDHFSKIQFEHLPVEPGIMNVFRISEDCFSNLSRNLNNVSFHHTYSNIIRRLTNTESDLPSEFISIQFYNTSMIVALMKDRKLHFIQSFIYETPEDVLYYLLNLTQRFELYSEELSIQISGLIDLDFKLYRELIKYFKNIKVENVDASNLLLNINEHPAHYFTPFFNLAL